MHLIQLLSYLTLLMLTTAHPTTPTTQPKLNITLVNKVQTSDLPAGTLFCGVILQAAAGAAWSYQLQVDHEWHAVSDLSCKGNIKMPHCDGRYEYQSVSSIYSGCTQPCRVALDNGDLFWAYNSILLPKAWETAFPPAPVAALCCGQCSYEP